MNRILLPGGTLLDGRRDATPKKCDLLIEGDRIRRIGPAIRAPGARVLAAEGLIVAPGFIDVALAQRPARAPGFLRAMPGLRRRDDGDQRHVRLRAFPARRAFGGAAAGGAGEKGVRADWRDAAGYFARVESFGSAINRGFLAGHGAIRSAVVGYAARAATASQLRRMEALLDECLEQGALGFSSGLCYPPGCFAERARTGRALPPPGRHGPPLLHAHAQRGPPSARIRSRIAPRHRRRRRAAAHQPCQDERARELVED